MGLVMLVGVGVRLGLPALSLLNRRKDKKREEWWLGVGRHAASSSITNKCVIAAFGPAFALISGRQLLNLSR